MCAEMLSQINIVITGPCLTQTLPRGLFVEGSFDNIIIKHYIFLKPVCLRIHESLNSEYPGGCLGLARREKSRREARGGAGEGEITSVEFWWKIEFLFHVLGAVVILGHCGEKTDLDERGVVLSANGPWLLCSVTDLVHPQIWVSTQVQLNQSVETKASKHSSSSSPSLLSSLGVA